MESAADLLRTAGFSEVTMSNLADVHILADHASATAGYSIDRNLTYSKVRFPGVPLQGHCGDPDAARIQSVSDSSNPFQA